MTAVVGVHGVGNLIAGVTPAEASEALERIWANALAAGPASSHPARRVIVAYYAHHLTPAGAHSQTPNLNEFPPLATAMTLSWGQQLGAPQPIAQGQVTRPVRALISWIAQHFGLHRGMVEWFVGRFFSEVATYFGDPARRAAAREAVLETMTRHASPVVIAHSLGSVVAYEALWRPNAPVVDHLITVGSPLAMPDVVRHRLKPQPDPQGTRPPTVRRWTDIADIGDLVAIPRPLRIHFDGVDNESQLPIAPFDFHRVRNYLKSTHVAIALNRQ
jgi:hypothetical protein